MTPPDPPSDPRPDGELVRRMAAGDREAMAALYARYAGTLLGVAIRIIGRRGEAEDLVHDVFLEAWRKADRWRADRGTVRTWLLLRLRSRAIDRLRSPRLARGVSLDEGCPDYAERTVAPDDPALAADRRRVREAVASLPPEHRTVLTLAAFEGRSAAEIARRLELPLGTVKSRILAARRGLKAACTGGQHEA